ncbi:MAG: RNB domain-containing ribonuclease [Desulfovibrionaceae bacterium]|nr:RNB domain-containing ribonuclease [Desulfovibrionaceae bacterium]
MAEKVSYPSVGCLVEYLDGNVVQIALVIDAVKEKLRVFLPNRREANLPSNRLLPWLGPIISQKLSRDEMVKVLEEHRAKRLALSQSLDMEEIWQLAQGEVDQATCQWMAELVESDPDYDTIAAYGRAMLLAKIYFRFQPPGFLIYDAETVEKRRAEQQKKEQREALLAQGRAFFNLLWEVSQGRKNLPPPHSGEWPKEEIAKQLESLLRLRLLNPEDPGSETLWGDLTQGLPEVPQIPVQLLMAWGKLPPHYNVWLAQTSFDPSDSWWEPYREEVLRLDAEALNPKALTKPLGQSNLGFISIDSAETKDIDDSFYVEKIALGWKLTLAMAAPALSWNFGSPFDLAVRERATSLYLPERTSHMLPECLGIGSYSLWAKKERVALLVELYISQTGEILSCEPSFARVRLSANLNYVDCEEVLTQSEVSSDNQALPYRDLLREGWAMAKAMQRRRVSQGAIVMEREDPHLSLEGEGLETRVILKAPDNTPNSQMLVAECMIGASAALADFAVNHHLAMLYRTQNVEVPPEYAGVWRESQDIFRAMRVLIPSILETEPHPHAALGLSRYAPSTSPLRRYGDLINEAQLVSFWQTGAPKFSQDELEEILKTVNLALSNVGSVQRHRPRYWKLLYFKQQGDKVFWPGVVCDDGDSYLTVNLPDQSLSIRAKRQLFDERVGPGTAVKVRIGKVQPLWNDIQILEAVTDS